MFHLFANEFAGLRRRRLAFALVFAGAFDCFFLWHTKDTLPREPSDVGWRVLRFHRRCETLRRLRPHRGPLILELALVLGSPRRITQSPFREAVSSWQR